MMILSIYKCGYLDLLLDLAIYANFVLSPNIACAHGWCLQENIVLSGEATYCHLCRQSCPL